MAEKALQAWQRMLFQETSLTKKDYETDEENKTPEERERLNAKRFEGYQKLCLAGLGTMFWGTAAGVLPHLKNELLSQQKMIPWVQYSLTHLVKNCSIYGTLALVLMLMGLCASTFPSSSPLAACTAGLGGWQAFVFILGTFHVASLKYYSNIEECFFYFLGASVAATIYWGFSAQDPLLLHLFLKLIMWVISVLLFAVCFALYYLFRFFMCLLSGIFWFLGLIWRCLGACFSSLVNAVSAVIHLVRGYQPAPGQGHQPQP